MVGFAAHRGVAESDCEFGKLAVQDSGAIEKARAAKGSKREGTA
jgi:hypothetical protein